MKFAELPSYHNVNKNKQILTQCGYHKIYFKLSNVNFWTDFLMEEKLEIIFRLEDYFGLGRQLITRST